MKAIWKGYVRFSLVTIPIRIYNAVDAEQTIRFNQLHKEDNGPIGYQKVCKKCGKTVSAGDIVKGFAYEPDRYVIVEKEDLEKIKLKSTKMIDIEGFIDARDVDPMLFDVPYFAGPDGPVAVKAYLLLAATLKETGQMGVGKVVLRDREETVMLAAKENGIILYKLRAPNELRKISQVPELEKLPVDKKQLELAKNLVGSMETSLNILDFSDKYNDALRAMIESKISGKQTVRVEEEEKAPAMDIMTALRQSIDHAKSERKPMERATRAQKKAAVDGKQTKTRKTKSA
jgi:DNA end-binding protein Ku